MNYLQIIAIIVALANLIASSFYFWDTIKGKTKPNRVTFLLWSVPLVGVLVTNHEQFHWSTLAILTGSTTPLIILLASFLNKNAYWKLQKFDYICGILGIMAFAFWFTTKNPILTLTLGIVADFLAGLPTLLKILKAPETETKKSYTINAIFYILNLLTIKAWIFTEYAFPMYFCLFNLVLISAFFVKPPSLRGT